MLQDSALLQWMPIDFLPGVEIMHLAQPVPVGSVHKARLFRRTIIPIRTRPAASTEILNPDMVEPLGEFADGRYERVVEAVDEDEFNCFADDFGSSTVRQAHGRPSLRHGGSSTRPSPFKGEGDSAAGLHWGEASVMFLGCPGY